MSVNVLIDGFDQGHFTLPAELVSAARAVEPLQTALDEQPHAPQLIAEAKARFQADLLEAARTGKKLPLGAELTKAKMAADAQAEVLEVLREALRQSERHLATSFGLRQHKILTNHLQPAFEETISKARKAKASQELSELRLRYDAIRAARSVLHRIPAPVKDVHGVFSEFRNLDEWWPQFYPERSRQQVQDSIQRTGKEMQERASMPAPSFTPAPWPADELECFKWVIANAQPWLPTPEEQDARFEQYIEKSNAEYAAAVAHGRAQGAIA